MKIVALAGGVGGAKLADGLSRALLPEDLTIIVNTGDDFEHWGLRVSPDLDTVCYTLAGLADPEAGWGLRDETWNALGAVSQLGGADWFRIGDRDLATHLERTRRLRTGWSLSQVTADFCRTWGIKATILPMSDDPVSTIVETADGELAFQEYFVHRRCEPRVSGFHFAGIESAKPAPGVLEAIDRADAIVICPSNPWVSIDPILALIAPPMSPSLPLSVGVSPLIGGRAVKGPAAKMFAELGLEPTALSVAQHYQESGLVGMVLDSVDAAWSGPINELGIRPYATDTLMVTTADRLRLAQAVLDFVQRLSKS